MKRMWQICVLWVFWVLVLCLTVPCLDQKPASAPRERVMHLAPRRGHCLWFRFRKHGCPPGTLNGSLCHRPARGQSWFDACYERTMGYLVGTTASVAPDSVLWWLGMNSTSELGKMWEKLFKVILRPSVSHSHLYCRTCVLVGNSKILLASGVSNNVTRHTTAFGFWKKISFPSGMEPSTDQEARFGFLSEKRGKREKVNQNMPSTEAEMEVISNS